MKLHLFFTLIFAVALNLISAFHVPIVTKTRKITDSSKGIDAFLPNVQEKVRKFTNDKTYRLFSAAPSAALSPNAEYGKKLGPVGSTLTKAGLVAYLLSVCIFVPLYLLPLDLMRKIGLITRRKREHLALRGSTFICSLLLRMIPFAKISITPPEDGSTNSKEEPEPSIWVCNHISMLDCFLLVAGDKRMRGPKRRPIKIVYWKQIENNPILKLIFTTCGGIPIEMVANAPGEANEYDKKSFRSFLKAVKQAFEEGFDVGILPEGQLNPSPESGLLPIFTGAYTLARMSKRPIKMVALNGAHNIWHAVDGIVAKDRQVKIRVFPGGKKFESPEDFEETFINVVGHFGMKGKDPKNLPELL